MWEKLNIDDSIDTIKVPGQPQAIWKETPKQVLVAHTKLSPYACDGPSDFVYFRLYPGYLHEEVLGELVPGAMVQEWVWHIPSEPPSDVASLVMEVVNNSANRLNHVKLINEIRDSVQSIETPDFDMDAQPPIIDSEQESDNGELQLALGGRVFASNYNKHGEAGRCSLCDRPFDISPEMDCKFHLLTSTVFPLEWSPVNGFWACGEHSISSLADVPYLSRTTEDTEGYSIDRDLHQIGPSAEQLGFSLSTEQEQRSLRLGPVAGFASQDILIRCNLEALETDARDSGVLTLKDIAIIDDAPVGNAS